MDSIQDLMVFQELRHHQRFVRKRFYFLVVHFFFLSKKTRFKYRLNTLKQFFLDNILLQYLMGSQPPIKKQPSTFINNPYIKIS